MLFTTCCSGVSCHREVENECAVSESPSVPALHVLVHELMINMYTVCNLCRSSVDLMTYGSAPRGAQWLGLEWITRTSVLLSGQQHNKGTMQSESHLVYFYTLMVLLVCSARGCRRQLCQCAVSVKVIQGQHECFCGCIQIVL